DYLAGGILQEELDHEKSAFVGSFIVGLDTNAGIASQLLSAEAFGFGPAHLDRYPEMVRRISLQEVNQAIHAYFKPEALFTVMAGQPPKRS
ncbi:MAG: insulinase family protein, partial [Acidobacteria bacterium]|nr:insulinase family protein [Acidobacteriota bacterium]